MQKDIFDIFSRDNKLHTTRNLQYQHLYKVQTEKKFHDVCSGCTHHMFMKWYHWLPQQVHIVNLQVQLISHSNTFSQPHNTIDSNKSQIYFISPIRKKKTQLISSQWIKAHETSHQNVPNEETSPVPVGPIINQKGKPTEKARVQIPLCFDESLWRESSTEKSLICQTNLQQITF